MDEPLASLSLTGGCTCRFVRYRLAADPMFVHCCHCTWCQRETGSAFALNALLESEHVMLEHGEVEHLDTPSASGRGQQIVRCPRCRVALWSHYPGMGNRVAFVRVGTLDEPSRVRPDIHIYVASKQPWIVLPEDARQVPEYYRTSEEWPPESLARLKKVRESRSA